MAANASSVEAPNNLASDQDLQTQQDGQQPPLPPPDQVVEISDNALDSSMSDSETQRTPEQALALSQQRAAFEASDGRDSTQGDPFPAQTMSPSKQPPASCEHKKGKQDPHQKGLCEGCKEKYGIPLCTEESRCDVCRPLSTAEFQSAVLNKRALNLRKKLNRLQRTKHQAPIRQSPRTLALLQQFGLDTHTGGTKIVRISKADSTPAATSTPSAQVLFDPPPAEGDFDIESASLKDMLDRQLNTQRFCMSRNLHPFTVQHAAGNPELTSLPLRDVSAYLFKTMPMHLKPPQIPNLPPSLLPFTQVGQPVASASGIGPQATPQLSEQQLSRARRDFIDLTNQMIADTDRSGMAPGAEHASQRPVSPVSAANLTDNTSKADNENFVRAIIQYVASHSPVDALAPKTVKEIRSSSQQPLAKLPKLCLTTADVVRSAVEARDEQFRLLHEEHRLPAYGRIANLSRMKVHTTSYTPADRVFPLDPPPMSPEFGDWLPNPARNSSVVVTMSDLEHLESLARSGTVIGSNLDSAIFALSRHHAPENPSLMYNELVDWIAVLIRDTVKASTSLATACMQMRREWSLQASKFNDQEKAALRLQPTLNAERLFDADKVWATIDQARRRTTDARDASLARMAK